MPTMATDDGNGIVVARDVAVAQFAEEGDGRSLRQPVHLVKEDDKRLGGLFCEHREEELDAHEAVLRRIGRG